MTTSLNSALSDGYTSNSQKARVLTENWVFENLYCPVCGNERINHFPNNQAVADFYCPACQEQFELKSKNGELKGKIVDGAYDTFIKRIEGDTNPDFLFMGYRMDDYLVHHLYFVPKFFFVPEMVEKRKPLGLKARRAGWIGCNILYDHIPEQGRIAIVHNAVVINQKYVQEQVQRAFALKIDNLESRGWMFDVLHCVNGISSDEFSLAQMYQFEEILMAKYPQNRNVKAKIRQQLQMLRDRGFIEFLGNGKYKKITL